MMVGMVALGKMVVNMRKKLNTDTTRIKQIEHSFYPSYPSHPWPIRV